MYFKPMQHFCVSFMMISEICIILFMVYSLDIPHTLIEVVNLRRRTTNAFIARYVCLLSPPREHEEGAGEGEDV